MHSNWSRASAGWSERGGDVAVLLALNDMGRPSYDIGIAAKTADMGMPVFAGTLDQFPDLMACALRREDIHQWAAMLDIKTVRADEREAWSMTFDG